MLFLAPKIFQNHLTVTKKRTSCPLSGFKRFLKISYGSGVSFFKHFSSFLYQGGYDIIEPCIGLIQHSFFLLIDNSLVQYSIGKFDNCWLNTPSILAYEHFKYCMSIENWHTFIANQITFLVFLTCFFTKI